MGQGAGAIIVGDETGYKPVRVPVEGVGDDPQFLHALLCQLGLPRRSTKERVFERRSGAASLLLEAGRWYNGFDWKPQPLPYGTRPRLVLINVCSEAVRTRSRTVHVEDSVRGFLRRLGIDGGGYSMAGFKAQMIALACCHMQLGYRTDRGVGQIDTKPISRFEAWLVEEDRQRGLWPGELDLSGPFFDSLIEHAVPLDASALMSLQHSAMALDVYTWMAHRLHRVTNPSGAILSWRALKEQFGQEFAETREFRRSFLEALTKAHEVYRDARLEIVRGGLKLLPSPPSVRSSRVGGRLPKQRALHPAAAPIVVPEEPAVTSETLPLLPETLARLKALDKDMPVEKVWRMYLGTLRGSGLPPNVDERFASYAKNFVGRSDLSSGVGVTMTAAYVISDAALAEAGTVAPGFDVACLERTFRDWNAGRNVVPHDGDSAFLGWVRSYTKGRKP